MGFSSALSILFSKLCSTHVRNDHDLQQKNGKILNDLNEPTLLREAPGLAKISEDQSEGKTDQHGAQMDPIKQRVSKDPHQTAGGNLRGGGERAGKSGDLHVLPKNIRTA